MHNRRTNRLWNHPPGNRHLPLCLRARRRRNLWFSGFSFAAALHSFGYAFELTANTIGEAFVCMQIEYLCNLISAHFRDSAALELTGNNRRLNRGAVAACSHSPSLTLILVHTNNLPLTCIMLTYLLAKIGAMAIVQVTPGIWYNSLHGIREPCLLRGHFDCGQRQSLGRLEISSPSTGPTLSAFSSRELATSFTWPDSAPTIWTWFPTDWSS